MYGKINSFWKFLQKFSREIFIGRLTSMLHYELYLLSQVTTLGDFFEFISYLGPLWEDGKQNEIIMNKSFLSSSFSFSIIFLSQSIPLVCFASLWVMVSYIYSIRADHPLLKPIDWLTTKCMHGLILFFYIS